MYTSPVSETTRSRSKRVLLRMSGDESTLPPSVQGDEPCILFIFNLHC